jgi:transcriptional regulator with XRE-family HTH domain
MIDKRKHLVNPDGEMLRYLREQLQMTQEEFAREFGVARNTITRSEMGLTKMKFTVSQVKTLFALLDRANISVYDLPDEPRLINDN